LAQWRLSRRSFGFRPTQKEFAFIGRGGSGVHRSFHRAVLMMYCDDPGVRLAVFLNELKEPGYLARR
jgi:hypothetical protein